MGKLLKLKELIFGKQSHDFNSTQSQGAEITNIGLEDYDLWGSGSSPSDPEHDINYQRGMKTLL